MPTRYWQHDDLGIIVSSKEEPRDAWTEVPILHEDELPPDVDYDEWYSLSVLSDGMVGVRIGPDPRWMRQVREAE